MLIFALKIKVSLVAVRKSRGLYIYNYSDTVSSFVARVHSYRKRIDSMSSLCYESRF